MQSKGSQNNKLTHAKVATIESIQTKNFCVIVKLSQKTYNTLITVYRPLSIEDQERRPDRASISLHYYIHYFYTIIAFRILPKYGESSPGMGKPI